MSQPAERKLGVYSLGFFKNRKLRRALEAVGWTVVPGRLTGRIDAIGIWGDRPVAARGKRAAARRGLPLLHIEDAPLRSVTADRVEPLMGLTIDETGNYLDVSQPSDLENLLNAPLERPSPEVELAFAEYLQSGLSKYNDHWRDPSELPDGPFVLVVDQLRDDASIALGGADQSGFSGMLEAAISDNPGVPVLVKRHPRAIANAGLGHFDDLPEEASFLEDGFSIGDVLDRAAGVYCVTSQVGFEAILRGHRPRLFGMPFYAGWGLSDDPANAPRRAQTHDAVSLFERVMIRYPIWFDVYEGGRCDFLTALRGLDARRRGHELKRPEYVALGMRLWKRNYVRQFLGNVRFSDDPDDGSGSDVVVWASSKEAGEVSDRPHIRMEDGFLRSIGLGAELAAPVSYCFDDLGIYYDPERPSRLEQLIDQRRELTKAETARAGALRRALVEAGLSKYNVGSHDVEVPDGRRIILVPGQVEDDASILKGAGEIRTNLALLEAVRADNPDAYIVYKPHPDVEAGLRDGGTSDVAGFCDQVLVGVSAEAALSVADEVSTITSLMGFEALLRGKSVVCYGRPFYAGWGLTEDRGAAIARRRAGVSLDGLVHAALIDYPVYRDPVSGLACPVEVVVGRLARGQMGRQSSHKLLSKLQGVLASQSWLWRRS